MGIRQIYLTNPKKFEDIINLELLGFEYFDCEIDISPYEFLIFTSKNGVIAAFKSGLDLASKKIICISNETANEVRNLGIEPFFVGFSGHGKDFANEIKNIVNSGKSLFFRPTEVASDLQEKLQAYAIAIDSVIIYKTTCQKLENFEIQKDALVIFTSPKTYHCFVSNFGWDESYTAIAIGKTTFEVFAPNIKTYCAPKTSIDSCIEFARNLADIV